MSVQKLMHVCQNMARLRKKMLYWYVHGDMVTYQKLIHHLFIAIILTNDYIPYNVFMCCLYRYNDAEVGSVVHFLYLVFGW